MIFLTTDLIDGHDIIEWYGHVSGECVMATNHLTNISGKWQDWASSGGKMNHYTKAYRNALVDVKQQLASQLRGTRANAIIGMSFQIDSFPIGDSMMVVVSGHGTGVLYK